MNKSQEPPSKKVKTSSNINNNSQRLLENWDRFDFRVLDVEKIYKTRSSEVIQIL